MCSFSAKAIKLIQSGNQYNQQVDKWIFWSQIIDRPISQKTHDKKVLLVSNINFMNDFRNRKILCIAYDVIN